MQQDQMNDLLYGDGLRVRPMAGLDTFWEAGRWGDFEAIKGSDGVWVAKPVEVDDDRR